MADESVAARSPVRGRVTSLAWRRLPGAWAAAGAGILSISLICATELLEPRLTSLGSLVLVVVLLAAWVLDSRLLWIVVALALGSRAVASWAGGLDAGTAMAESVAIVLIAGTARAAAAAKDRALAAERHAAEQQAALARMDERGRIAAEVRTTAVKKLFDATLGIQAAAELSPEEPRRRLQAAVSELDEVCSDLRSTIFRGTGG